MSTSNKEPNMVVTRQWNFPQLFMTDSLDVRLIGIFANAFHELIFKANLNDKDWDSRMQSFRKHGLLDLAIPLRAKMGPIEIDIPDGKGGTTRIVKEFDEPFSYGFDMRRIAIEREKLEDDPEYMEECAHILAYMFIWRMLKVIADNPENYKSPVVLFGTSEGRFVLLDKLCSKTLGEFLTRYHRGESTPETLANFLIGRSMEEAVDALPGFAIFDELEARLSRMAEEAHADSAPRFKAKIDAQVRDAKRELGLREVKNSPEPACCEEGICGDDRPCDVVSIMTAHSKVPHSKNGLVDKNVHLYHYQHRNDDNER